LHIIYKGGKIMKTDVNSLKATARSLVKVSKEKGLIKSHTVAFKEFPVSEEVHKGNKHYYNKKK